MTHPRARELLLLAGTGLVLAVGYIQIGERAAVAAVGWAMVYAILHLSVRALAPRADPLLVPMAGLLSAIGLLELASIDHARAQFASCGAGQRLCRLASLQTGWLAAGAVGFFVALYLFRGGLGPAWRLRYTLALGALAALLAPLIPGIGHVVNGARLWLRLGPLSFQPGEAAKVLLVLFLAAYLAERRELLALPTRRLGPLQVPDPRHLGPLGVAVGLALLIFVGQNDLGSSLLFFATFMAILWVATGKVAYPAFGMVVFAAGVALALQTFGHVRVRFEAWLHPDLDPQRSGFQLLMGQFAMGEGGITGAGLAGPDARPDLLRPGAPTDLILAAIGYSAGLAGVLAVLVSFIVLLTRAFLVALRSRSDLHALAAAGFGIVLGLQGALIAGGVTRVLPLTGVTLPFVSYGGSSLLANLFILGLLVAISHVEAAPGREGG